MSEERKRLIEEIKNYVPFNEQEEKDKEVMLQLLNTYDDIFLRSNRVAHMTASCWLVNPSMDKALMRYHHIYQSYSWLGGHADGDENLLNVALKEAKEESGLQDVRPVSEEILSLEILTVDGHEKHGEYVDSHLHVNVTYLLMADDTQPLIPETEECKLQWFSLEDAIASSNEPWFKERIYTKLNAKIPYFKKRR